MDVTELPNVTFSSVLQFSNQGPISLQSIVNSLIGHEANASVPIEVTEDDMLKVDNGQPLKALDPMDVTELPIFNVLSLAHPLKAESLMDVAEFPIVTPWRLLQPLNHGSISLQSIIMLSTELPRNASGSMDVIVDGISIEVNEQPLNAYCPIEVTLDGISTLEIMFHPILNLCENLSGLEYLFANLILQSDSISA